MMLQIGISDPALQRELGAVRNPTLAAFNDKIEGYEQAHMSTTTTAFGNAMSRGSSSRRPSNQGSRPAPCPNNPSVEVNGTGVSLCAANVFAALRAIILFLNALTRKELSAIRAVPWVILLRLVDVGRTCS